MTDKQNSLLGFNVELQPLKEVDRTLFYGELGNFSVTGFQVK